MPEALPKMLSCPEDLELILVNLLLNAAQAVDKDESWVRLRVERSDHLTIEVSDNGCGMDEKTRERAFDPLFATKSAGEGLGLGLYVCSEIMKRLGGIIKLDGELGRGSIFRVILLDPKFADKEGRGIDPVVN